MKCYRVIFSTFLLLAVGCDNEVGTPSLNTTGDEERKVQRFRLERLTSLFNQFNFHYDTVEVNKLTITLNELDDNVFDTLVVLKGAKQYIAEGKLEELIQVKGREEDAIITNLIIKEIFYDSLLYSNDYREMDWQPRKYSNRAKGKNVFTTILHKKDKRLYYFEMTSLWGETFDRKFAPRIEKVLRN